MPWLAAVEEAWQHGAHEIRVGVAHQGRGHDLEVLEDGRAAPAGAEEFVVHRRAVQDRAAEPTGRFGPADATPLRVEQHLPQTLGCLDPKVVVRVCGQQRCELGLVGRHPAAEPADEITEARFASVGAVAIGIQESSTSSQRHLH